MSYMGVLGPVVYNDNYFAVIQYCQQKGLLRRHPNCTRCGSTMSHQTQTKDKGSKDGYAWRCPDPSCRTMKTIRSGSFFEKSKIPLNKRLLLIPHWALDCKVATTAATIGVSRVTVMQINCFLREVCSKKLLKTPIVLGGPSVVVHIDESLFSHKCKAHRGRPPKEDVWVFGIVDTSHTPALGYMRVVPHRDARTLLPIIQTTLAPGSIVHSDEWAAYCSIQSTTGLTHRTANHSLHLVDPTTGVHTKNVESYWNSAKLKLKAMRGCTKDQLPSYLDEFMSKERFGRDQDDRFLNMLKHIAELY